MGVNSSLFCSPSSEWFQWSILARSLLTLHCSCVLDSVTCIFSLRWINRPTESKQCLSSVHKVPSCQNIGKGPQCAKWDRALTLAAVPTVTSVQLSALLATAHLPFLLQSSFYGKYFTDLPTAGLKLKLKEYPIVSWHKSCQKANPSSGKSSLTTGLSEPADDISRQGKVWDTGSCEARDPKSTLVRQLNPEWEKVSFKQGKCQEAWLYFACPK